MVSVPPHLFRLPLNHVKGRPVNPRELTCYYYEHLQANTCADLSWASLRKHCSSRSFPNHLTPVRMTTIKKIESYKCYQRCGEIRTLGHCWWEWKRAQPLWETVWLFLKKKKINKNRSTKCSRNSVFGYTPERTENGFQRDICNPCSQQHYSG